jgi:hypothetical protein
VVKKAPHLGSGSENQQNPSHLGAAYSTATLRWNGGARFDHVIHVLSFTCSTAPSRWNGGARFNHVTSSSFIHLLNGAIEVERGCRIQSCHSLHHHVLSSTRSTAPLRWNGGARFNHVLSSTADLDMIAYSSHPMTSVTPISMWRLVFSAS